MDDEDIKKALLEKITSTFESIRSDFQKIDKAASNVFGDSAEKHLSKQYQEAKKIFSLISDFSPLNHESQLRKFLSDIEKAKTFSRGILIYLRDKDITHDYKEEAYYLNIILHRCYEILNPEETIQDLKSTVTQQKDVIYQTKAESTDTSTKDAAEFFENNATSYNENATRWIWITIALAIMTFFFALISVIMAFEEYPKIENTFHFARTSGASLFFVTFLLSATIWSGRMYKSNMHLHSINQHKAISLKTVARLRAGGLTAEAQDIITTEAAKSIFIEPPTGLISDKSSNNSLTITDLIKTPNS